MKRRYAIVGGGPKRYIPNLKKFENENTIWIGADQGSEVIIENEIPLDIAIGDFDSVSLSSLEVIKEHAQIFDPFPDEKNETDLELAIKKAISFQAEEILLFGVTGGRLDHSLVNIQILYPIWQSGIRATIIDLQNRVELVGDGIHTIQQDNNYPYVSFLPVTLDVHQLSLQGFYYPLKEAHLSFGSTRCISNYLIKDHGTFSFSKGIVLVIRSKDLF
ncbi:thiamine diphosphokinase [Halobacillus seohaensis]|uniref:Thiamine diphosphokinase n=1 Tax=Halobacillus seohaensis TaxID=447421 RepID=A0ABW2EK48_9BACI